MIDGGGRKWTADDIICRVSVSVTGSGGEQSEYLALKRHPAHYLLKQDGLQKTVGALVGGIVTELLKELNVDATVTTNIMITEQESVREKKTKRGKK